MTEFWLERDQKNCAPRSINIGTWPKNIHCFSHFLPIFTHFPLLNNKRVEIWNSVKKFLCYLGFSKPRFSLHHVNVCQCEFFRSSSPNFGHIHSVILILSRKYSSLLCLVWSVFVFFLCARQIELCHPVERCYKLFFLKGYANVPSINVKTVDFYRNNFIKWPFMQGNLIQGEGSDSLNTALETRGKTS